MNTTGAPQLDESTIQAIVGIAMVFGLCFSIAITALITHFTARAVKVVPVEQRRIQPGTIWGLTVVYWVLSIASGGVYIMMVGGAEAAGMFSWGLVVLQVVLLAVNMLWIWWVGRGVPGSFSNAFQGYQGDAGVPAGDHGRSLGRWMIGIYAVVGVLSLVTIALQGPSNPAEDIRTQLASAEVSAEDSMTEADGAVVATDSGSGDAADSGVDSGVDSGADSGVESESTPEAAAPADTTGSTSQSPAGPDALTAEEKKQLEEMMAQGPVLILSCVEGLLSLVYLVLLITFLVKITNLRRSLLDLQFAASQPHAESHDSGVPPLA